MAWATPGYFTIQNYPCNEDGSNCQNTDGNDMQQHTVVQYYQDPALQQSNKLPRTTTTTLQQQ